MTTRSTMKRRAVQAVVLISGIFLAVAIAYAWGGTAHKFINKRAVIHLPSSMNTFKADSLFYESHASDPDIRRSSSDTTFGAEQWRHYIDIDEYPDFYNLPHDLDSLIAIYDTVYVKRIGMVPWAIGWVMDSLTAQLARGDNAAAKQSAADLGHYVGDSHQPLHVTTNYNGQLTGNLGIHSRYESTMINNFSSSLAVHPDSIEYIESPVDFAFEYIYDTFQYVDSVLAADDYAKTATGWNGSGSPPSNYYDTLWARTGNFTLYLIQKATTDLASLWYTAHVNAHQPKFASTPDSINFGEILIGAFKKDSISVTNTGTALLHIDSVTSSNTEFTVTPETTSINPSQSKKFYVTFTPQNSGIRTGTLTITHNAEGSPETISLRGNGMLTAVNVSIDARWNLVSNPLSTDNDSVLHLFPSSLFPYAYAYSSDSGYLQREELQNGSGYWEKFPSGGTTPVMGLPITSDSIDVFQGWNLIGSISEPVLTSAIMPVGTTILSQYYSYNNGYREADTIIPGKGYWIKVGTNGQLILSSSAAAQPKQNIAGNTGRLVITDAEGNSGTLFFTGYTEDNSALYQRQFELPPSPPLGIFDVRFSSNQRNVVADKENVVDNLLMISSARYPLTVQWENHNSQTAGTLLVNKKEIQLTASGSMLVSEPARLQLRLSPSSASPEIPDEFALKQNFPNPFNPSTTITYQVPSASDVSIVVYNVLGEEVAGIVSGLQQAGTYSVPWDASGEPGGVYFCRMNAGAFTETRKLVLIK